MGSSLPAASQLLEQEESDASSNIFRIHDSKHIISFS